MTYVRKSWRAAFCVLTTLLMSQAVPAGNTTRENASAMDLGRSVYDAKCPSCHGIDGKGDGNAAALLSPRPRNFTTGIFKFRSTESGSIPTDDDLMRTVQDGLHGTAMPDWEPFLHGDSLKAVILVRSYSARLIADTVMIGDPMSLAIRRRSETRKSTADRLSCARSSAGRI